MDATGGSLRGRRLTKSLLRVNGRRGSNLRAYEDVGDFVLLAQHGDVGNDVHRVNVGRQDENATGEATPNETDPFSFFLMDFTTSFTPRRVHFAFAAMNTG